MIMDLFFSFAFFMRDFVGLFLPAREEASFEETEQRNGA
jgi:hypothetical protein